MKFVAESDNENKTRIRNKKITTHFISTLNLWSSSVALFRVPNDGGLISGSISAIASSSLSSQISDPDSKPTPEKS